MNDKPTKYREEVGRRLRLFRERMALRQEDIGQIIGMVANGISQIEKGTRGIDPEDAVRLKRAKGVSLDWLYANDPASLSTTLYDKLIAPQIVATQAQSPAKAKRKKGG